MILHTFLDKCNTIIRNSNLNTGINPVGELSYGLTTTRLLVHFPIDKIKTLIDDKTMPDKSKLRHVLKMVNTNGIDLMDLHCNKVSSTGGTKKRAVSFDLIFFLIPKEWDRGKGFHFTDKEYNFDSYRKLEVDSERLHSIEGCNWFQARNGIMWDEAGVYSLKTLEDEYNKFSSDEGSAIIIGRQHFDKGYENISLDITDTVNRMIDGEIDNYGIGIAFTPGLESSYVDWNEHYTLGDFTKWVNTNKNYENSLKEPLQKVLDEAHMPSQYDRNEELNNFKLDVLGYGENYVGFFTDKTNTFFEPFLETVYSDYINDDRSSFCLDKANRLYFYSSVAGNPVNLDEMPTCKIVDDDDNVLFTPEVKQTTKGAYYVEETFPSSQYEADYMYHDVWSNILYEGIRMKDVELDFTLTEPSSWIGLGSSFTRVSEFSPSISGIKSDEEVRRGDVRKLTVNALVKYENKTSQLVGNTEIRLYVMDGHREIDVLPFHQVNKSESELYTLIDTSMLIPNRYFVDVKFKYNMQEIVHHDVLHFKITDDLTNKYYNA